MISSFCRKGIVDASTDLLHQAKDYLETSSNYKEGQHLLMARVLAAPDSTNQKLYVLTWMCHHVPLQ